MRVMTFTQWFQLLKNIFETFLLFLQRIKVALGLGSLQRFGFSSTS